MLVHRKVYFFLEKEDLELLILVTLLDYGKFLRAHSLPARANSEFSGV